MSVSHLLVYLDVSKDLLLELATSRTVIRPLARRIALSRQKSPMMLQQRHEVTLETRVYREINDLRV